MLAKIILKSQLTTAYHLVQLVQLVQLLLRVEEVSNQLVL